MAFNPFPALSPRLRSTAVLTGACVGAAVVLDFIMNVVFRVGSFTPWSTVLIGVVVATPAWLYILGQREALQEANARLVAVLKARDEAVAASNAKTAFVAHMSHELRTPLDAIIGYSEIMLETAEEDARAADAVDHRRVLVAAKHLVRLIGDVLDFAKVDAGKVAVEPTWFDAAELAHDAAAALAPAARDNGDTLDINCAPDLGSAHTDRLRLMQCLLNLLANAVKSTKNGRVRLDARRERADGADWLVFSVSDTGAGIAPERMARLFETFEQGDIQDSVGLGLVIARRLARLLGGDLTAVSAPGEGSALTLRVPVRFAGEAATPRPALKQAA